MKLPHFPIVCGLALIGAVAAASAQSSLIPVTVSTSSQGTFLLTLPEEVSFLVTNAPSSVQVYDFVFQNGDPSRTWGGIINLTTAISTLQVSDNGGPAYPLIGWSEAYSGGAMTSADSFMWSDAPPIINGDLVTLHAGTLSVAIPSGFAVLVTGNYNMFLTDDAGGAISGLGVLGPIVIAPVPEPATLALFGLGALGTRWQLRRRQK